MNDDKTSADIYIYGDITSWPWYEEDTSSYTLSKQLQEIGDVDEINVYINSYGGEVSEGLAIYNSLKRSKAKVITHADGFACSIASVIFSAGDERIMSNTSLLMIHNALVNRAAGNAKELRKLADDLETITQASINAYMNIVNIEETELKQLLDEETWLNANIALEKGFATQVIDNEEKEVPTQSIKNSILQKMLKEPNQIDSSNNSNSNYDDEKLEKLINEKIKEAYKDTNNNEEDLEKNDDDENLINQDNKISTFMKSFFIAQNKEEK